MALRQPGDIIHGSYGYKFTCTPDHLSDEELDFLRASHDELGSAVIERLYDIIEHKKVENGEAASNERPDMLALLAEHRSEDKTLQALWDEVNTIPDWVNFAQLERGQRVFNRYAAANFMGLLILGFIRENSVIGLNFCLLSLTLTSWDRVLQALQRFLPKLAASLQNTFSLVWSRLGLG
jgi:hypothetical protein